MCPSGESGLDQGFPVPKVVWFEENRSSDPGSSNSLAFRKLHEMASIVVQMKGLQGTECRAIFRVVSSIVFPQNGKKGLGFVE